MFKTQIDLPGLHDQTCVGVVSMALRAVAGVGRVHVDLARRTVVIEHGGRVSILTLLNVARGAGYRPDGYITDAAPNW